MNSVPYFQNQISKGGVTKGLSSTFLLYAYLDQGKKSSLCKQGESTGYQVPVGFKMKVSAIEVQVNGTGTNYPIAPLYSDNDLGLNLTATPTNPVYLLGSNVNFQLYVGSSVNTPHQMPLDFEVPAGKYFGFVAAAGTGTVGIIAVCELVAV